MGVYAHTSITYHRYNIMEKRISNIGQRALVTLVAKEIKKCHRNTKNENKGVVDIPIYLTSYTTTHIIVSGKMYGLDSLFTRNDINNLIKQALQESRCNGISFVKDEIVRVIVFAKPRKPFCMLARLLSKYAGYNIEWDEIKAGDRYLCHEDDLCQEGVNFIRQKKGSRDKLFAEVVTSTNGDVIEKMLQLTIATPKGKFKHGKILAINV